MITIVTKKDYVSCVSNQLKLGIQSLKLLQQNFQNTKKWININKKIDSVIMFISPVPTVITIQK